MRRQPKTADHTATANLLAAIVQASDAAIISKTLDGIVTSWNPSAERIFGYTREEMIGQPIGVIASPNRPEEMRDILDRVRRGIPVEPHETERRRKDGTLVPISLTVSPVIDEGGRIVGASKIAVDISSRKSIEAQLRAKTDQLETLSQQQRWALSMLEEREARLRSVLETAPDAIVTIDEHGMIQSFSHAAEKLFGYGAGEIVGRNVSLLMAPGHRGRHDGYIRRYRRTGERRIIGIGREVEAQRKDGSVFPMELAVGEAVVGETRIFTGFIRDITARARLEQDLRQAQRMEAIGQLTGGIAHDFNNLLTVIQGNLEMLQGRVHGADTQDLVTDALEATGLGAQLSRRLLAFGRRQSLVAQPVDLNALVSGMTDLLRRTLGDVVRVETRLAPRLPITRADPGQIENALLNLAINARDAMPGGGAVLIATGRSRIDAADAASGAELEPGTYVTLSVSDTGTGMSAEVRQRAFEPYFTTKPPGAGSGLGLSMVYGFVKQSGGHIQLLSEPGQGTTVRIFLKAAGTRHTTPKPLDAAPHASPAKRHRILVVEDDPRVRRIAVRRLERLGYTVVEAADAASALKAIEREPPFDAMFTDIAMPGGMTGLELARDARARRPGLRVLLTSGFAEPEAIKGGLMAARTAWIGKPYATAELVAKLNALLAT